MFTHQSGHKMATEGVLTAALTAGQAVDLRFCGPRGTRTHNPRIKSPLLCQLS
jgi:hypothetical protein